MGLLDTFHVSRLIATVLAGRHSSAEVASAVSRLRGVGRNAMGRIITALPDDPPGDPLTNLLADLITTATLSHVVEHGLLVEDPPVVNRVRMALMRGTKYDPNRLVDLYASRGGSLVNLADVIVARKEAVTPKTMLRILDAAHRDAQPALFKAVSELATDPMVPHLIAFSKNAEWEARYCIAQTIAGFSTEPVRDTLLRFLKDPHKQVRQAAVEGLARMTIPVPAGPIAALLRDSDLMVQTRAIETMIKLNDPTAVRELIDVLQDESEHARRAAVEVLNAIGDASAIKDLLQAMKDQDWWVRVRAADALGAIGGPKVIDAVLSLLEDPDEFMRRCAVEILNTTKDPRAFDKLVQALDDPDWWVRERALDALANMRDPRAVPAIARFLEFESEATPVAIRALASIGDTRAAPIIAEKLDSDDEAILREAITALEAMTDMKSAESVLASLSLLARRSISSDIVEQATRARKAISARVRGRPARGASDQRSALPLHSGRTQVIQAVPAKEAAPPARASAPPPPAPPAAKSAEPEPSVLGSIDPSSLTAGQVLGGRYKLKREIGRGGFGVVLLVEDLMVNEDIALKLISPHLTEDQIAITRMVQEVRYARKVTHENVIRIHDFVSFGRTYAMSMEYFASSPLTRHMRSGRRMPRNDALRMVCDMLRGMAVAHAAGIVHRDLKPANILVNSEGALKIVDFGLAAAMSHSNSRLTKTGSLVGTPTYMAPEQVRGTQIDQRTDLYALGVIMYEVFSGVPPYVSDNPMGVLYQHLEGRKVPPSEHNPEISAQLEAVILRAMSVAPEERYQSAAEMLGDLESLMLREAA